MKQKLLLFFCLLMAAPALRAQNCDPWITKAYRALYNRIPNTEECRIANYNGGKWSSYPELVEHIAKYNNARSGNHLKGDPWIFRAYAELYDRGPNGIEVNINLYNGGTWGNYNELKNYIQETQTNLQRVGAVLNQAIDNSGTILTSVRTALNNALALINNNGQIIAQGDDVLSQVSATLRKAAEARGIVLKPSGNKKISVGRKGTRKLMSAGSETIATSGNGAIFIE